MLLSCVMFLGLLFKLGQEIYPNVEIFKFHLTEALVVCVVIILVISMGSSSLVEEEQYLWHFMTSTHFLVLLRETIKSTSGNNNRTFSQRCLIALVLISGRVLRGWYQGGVNWTHLPDISKSLEISGNFYIKSFQLVSVGIVLSLCLCTLSSLWYKSKGYIIIVVGLTYVCGGLLVLQYVMKYQGSGIAASDNDAILAAQLIYSFIITCSIATVIASPWFMSFQNKHLVLVIKDCLYLCGTTYMFGWCLLQLLLQKPVNSMPISLLLVQILATIYYASHGGSDIKQWVEVNSQISLLH